MFEVRRPQHYAGLALKGGIHFRRLPESTFDRIQSGFPNLLRNRLEPTKCLYFPCWFGLQIRGAEPLNNKTVR
jgi:hypothetical protein